MQAPVIVILSLLIGLALPADAETLLAARTIRSQSIISAADLIIQEETVPGALSRPDEAVGLEARVVLYAGRPIRPGDVGPAAVIERNQIVTIVYHSGTLRIATEARSLGRAGVGDMLRVINLASRTTVAGVVGSDGTVTIGYE